MSLTFCADKTLKTIGDPLEFHVDLFRCCLSTSVLLTSVIVDIPENRISRVRFHVRWCEPSTPITTRLVVIEH